MEIRPFAIERFYERWEFRAELMLSSSDCESRALAELLELEPDAHERLLALRLGYTEVPGSPELCAAVSELYEQLAPTDVLTLAAAEEGIFIAYHALLGPGDHVVVEAPCYGSAIELARSTGAEVSLWQRRYEDGWAHDLDALEAELRPQTKLIYINSPHNPTGTADEQSGLRARRRARPRALDRALQRRGLPRARARSAHAAACRVRRLRARDLARAPSPRPTGCPGCASAGWPAATRRCSRASGS